MTAKRDKLPRRPRAPGAVRAAAKSLAGAAQRPRVIEARKGKRPYRRKDKHRGGTDPV